MSGEAQSMSPAVLIEDGGISPTHSTILLETVVLESPGQGRDVWDREPNISNSNT